MDEKESCRSEKLEFTSRDMLAAFKHGVEFVRINSIGDLSNDTPMQSLPFWEWLAVYHGGLIEKIEGS